MTTGPIMTILDFMRMQRGLQIGMKEANPELAGDPMELKGDDLADFMRWNAFALDDEVHEALAEVGWKPWATSRHVNHPEFMREMVDAWHFFLNMLLAGAGASGCSIWEMATQFENYYIEKNQKNLQRQLDGYDGVSTKCPVCKRELSECPPELVVGIDNVRWCSVSCYYKDPTTDMDEEDMQDREKEDIAALQADIEQRSGEQQSQSAEETAEAAVQKHREAQMASGFDVVGPQPKQERWGKRPGEVGGVVMTPQVGDQAAEYREDHSIVYHGANPHAYAMVKNAETTGEPLFCFRARDFFAIQVLTHYLDIVERFGPDDATFHENIVDAIGDFKEWQKQNMAQVRFPD